MATDYQLVTRHVVVLKDKGPEAQEFRVQAPNGKKPVAGGWKTVVLRGPVSSYPDRNEWVFTFVGSEHDFAVDLYVTCL